MRHNIKDSLLRAIRQGERGYEATKASATGANRCWCGVLRRAATQQ